MTETKVIGNTAEMACMLECIRVGIQVSLPFGENSRYDFIADFHNKLYRIQVKHCLEIIDNDNNVVAIKFKTVRQSGNNANHWSRKKYKKDEIDYFATEYKGKCYLIPVDQCLGCEKRLRILPTKNKQIAKVSFLKDFELNEMLKYL